MGADSRNGASYDHARSRCASSPALTDQYRAVPLYGHIVRELVASRRSSLTSSFGKYVRRGNPVSKRNVGWSDSAMTTPSPSIRTDRELGRMSTRVYGSRG